VPLDKFRICDECNNLLSRGGALKPEQIAKLAAAHGDAMIAQLRDPYQRHGLLELLLEPWSGVVPIGTNHTDRDREFRARQVLAGLRLYNAISAEQAADAEDRRNRSRVRTEAECRAVRERFIAGNVPAWLDPRSK